MFESIRITVDSEAAVAKALGCAAYNITLPSADIYHSGPGISATEREVVTVSSLLQAQACIVKRMSKPVSSKAVFEIRRKQGFLQAEINAAFLLTVASKRLGDEAPSVTTVEHIKYIKKGQCSVLKCIRGCIQKRVREASVVEI